MFKRICIHVLLFFVGAGFASATPTITITPGPPSIDHGQVGAELTAEDGECWIDGVSLFPLATTKTCVSVTDEFGSLPTAVGKAGGSLTVMTTLNSFNFPTPGPYTVAETEPAGILAINTFDRIITVNAGGRVWRYNTQTQIYEDLGLAPNSSEVKANDMAYSTSQVHPWLHVGNSDLLTSPGSTRAVHYGLGAYRQLPQCGKFHDEMDALVASHDGQGIGGHSGIGERVPCVWLRDNPFSLVFSTYALEPLCEDPENYTSSEAVTAISEANGVRIFTGASCGEVFFGFAHGTWAPSQVINLRDVLLSQGVDPSAFPSVLGEVTWAGVTSWPDDLTFKGNGFDGDPLEPVRWVINVPESGAAASIISCWGLLWALYRRKEDIRDAL